MKQRNKIFDFTDPQEHINLGAMVDELSTYEEQKVADFITDLKKQESEQKERKYVEWVKVAILPIWENYARKTHSLLELQETDSEIYVLISNKDRFDIYGKETGVRMAIGLSAHCSIEYIDGELRIDLVYALEEPIE